jgi:hypothetical protein
MITSENGTYLLRCDCCGQEHSTKATAVTMEQFKRLIGSWGWAFDTEHGDLCKLCAKAWRAGKLET